MSAGILRLLGAPAFEDGTTAHRFARERVYQVIAYLAYEGDWIQRGVLAALFYGEHSEPAARRNLRKLLLRARSFDWCARGLQATRETTRLAIDTDVQALIAAAHARRTQDVIEFYRGPFLEGLEAPECRGFNEWLETQREHLRTQWRSAMLATLPQVPAAEARELSARLIAADPLDEAAVHAHMVALRTTGDQTQARRVYRVYAERLAAELGIEPSVDLRALADSAVTPAIAPPRAAAVADESDADGFIGRVAELQQIAALLAQDDCRLLTLLGPGGVGKSSLARRALRAFVAPGCTTRFVALEEITAAEFGSRLARDLELNLAGNAEALPQVIEFLRDRPALLVLDNFEHLARDSGVRAQLLDGLLANCPQLKLLVTSRVRLDAAREWLLPLEGLPYPALEDDDRADSFDAVRLFVRAARRVKPDFAPAAERAAVVEICRQVEGLPLALEIAAAWTRLLTCQAIVVELQRGTALLRTPSGTRPARQASIEAVFEHSWRLLAPIERETLARLAIFRSAFSCASARAVAGASLPVLAALADKSLLQRLPGDRCCLHALVQRFAHARLNQSLRSDAAREVAQRHAEHYCALLSVHASMESVQQRDALQRIEPELPDALAALAWARSENRADLAGPSALVLAQLFDLTGRPREGLAVLGRLDALAPTTTRAQARAHGQLAIGHATLLARLARFAPAADCANQALRAYRSAADAEGIRMALSILSTMSLKLGRHAESRRHCLHGLKAAERARDQVGIATFLNNLGQVENELGHWDTAIDQYQRALEVNQKIGNQVGVIAQMNNLALAHIGAGRFAQVLGLLREGLRQVDESGFGALKTYFMVNLARAHLEMGDDVDAGRCAAEGLALARSFADPTNVPGLLIVQAELARKRGAFREAHQLLREAAEVTQATQHRRWVVRTLLACARVLAEAGDVRAAARMTCGIEQDPTATKIEIAQARALLGPIVGDLAPAELGEQRAADPPSIDRLLSEVAAGLV
jgi:predicted ATPase